MVETSHGHICLGFCLSAFFPGITGFFWMNSSLLVLELLINTFILGQHCVSPCSGICEKTSHSLKIKKKKLKPINTVRFCLMELKQDIDRSRSVSWREELSQTSNSNSQVDDDTFLPNPWQKKWSLFEGDGGCWNRRGGIEFSLASVEFELPMEHTSGYGQVAGCVSYTYGKSSELELFNWILSVCRD